MPKRKKLVDIKTTRTKKKVCAPGEEFVFRLPSGQEVGRAKDIVEFIEWLKNAPVESISYHAGGRHFNAWLKHIGEDGAASRIRNVSGSGEDLRKTILRRI